MRPAVKIFWWAIAFIILAVFLVTYAISKIEEVNYGT